MKMTIWNQAAVGSAAHEAMAPPGMSANYEGADGGGRR